MQKASSTIAKVLTGLLLLLALIGLSVYLQKETPVTVQSAQSYLPLRVGSTQIHVQLALTQSEQAAGLMYRTDLERDQGMLFVFKNTGQRFFWMRNTPLPLDLAYFDSTGRLQEIHALYPYDEKMVSSRSSAIKFALEMKQGHLDALGIKTGAQLDMKTLRAALKARGKNTQDFRIR
jgi:uncharacterized membrane protein (UPF0127 family)